MRPRAQRGRRAGLAWVAWVAWVACLAASCAPRTPPPAPEPAPRPDLIDRLLNRSLGLELRRWEVAAGAAEIEAALEAHVEAGAVGPAASEVLARNGLRLASLPVERLDALRRSLGPMILEVTAWHGQVFRWRPVHAVAIGPGPEALAVDGRVVRFDPGHLQLLARSWVVPMEDGPVLDLQLVPRLQRPAAGPPSLSAPRPAPGRLLPSLAVELSLRPGRAYLLAAEPPPAGSDAGAGPVAEGPLTIGEALLVREQAPPARVLLVFVPQLGAVP